MICRQSRAQEKIQLALRGEEIFNKLDPDVWRLEACSFMLEGVPRAPYGDRLTDLLKVEHSMTERRKQVESVLKKDECVVTFSTFPRIGCPSFTFPEIEINDPESDNRKTHSEFFPENAITRSNRFEALHFNIPARRGKKVRCNIPLMIDERTEKPFKNCYLKTEESRQAQIDNHIYMDAVGLGFGSSCLQVTFQASSLEQAKKLYDQLIPLAPIMMAITAASPIFRGFLADVDTRWSLISKCTDDRTEDELKQINKSRYASVTSYLSEENEIHNDIKLEKNSEVERALIDAGMETGLASHFAHLFIRDPIVVWENSINPDETGSDHFESIQSTNWQSMRFKPPPTNSDIGWRVEFRTMEVQLTEFENAAFSIFIILLTRIILHFNLDFVVPISKVDENMERAERRDAVLEEKFHFRGSQNELTELSCDEVINGGNSFRGLISYMNEFLENYEEDPETIGKILKYLDFISSRASGKLATTASWMRNFAMKHPDYNGDSVVSDKILFDLTVLADDIAHGKRFDSALLPESQEFKAGNKI